MSKQDKPKTEPAKPTLAAAVVATLATSFAECFTAATNSGSKLADFCAAAVGAKLPVKVETADVDAIVAQIATKLGWTDDRNTRGPANKSDARVIISQHALLPEGITAFRTATGSCGYHDAVKVARKLREHGDVTKAVADLTEAKEKAKANNDEKLTKALQSYWNAMRDGKRKDRQERMAAVVACATALKLSIKTE